LFFLILWHTVELIFPALSLANIKICFRFSLISAKDFEKRHPAFPRQPFFSTAYVIHVHVNFFTSNLVSQHSLSALRFFNRMVIVRTFIFCTKFCKPHIFAFSLSKSFGILSSLFSPHSTWQTSRLAFAFYKLIFSISALTFSHRTLIHSTQLPLFPQQSSFSLRALAEGNNATLRSIF
jgi:hypothetical protein